MSSLATGSGLDFALADGAALGLRAEAYLWALAVLGLGAVLLVAFAYVLVQRGPAWLAPLRQRLPAPARRFEAAARRWLADGGNRIVAGTLAAAAFLFLAYAFAEVTEGWMEQEALYQLDRDVHRAFQGALGGPAAQGLRLVTHAGDTLTVAFVSAVLALFFLYRRERARLVALVLAVGGGEAVVWSAKWLFGRARPGAQLTTAAGASFPSAHAFMSVVLYGFCTYLAWRYTERPTARWAATLGFGLLVLAVGLSRVLLSVHWVSDVLGGYVLGLAWLLGCLTATRAAWMRRRGTVR